MTSEIWKHFKALPLEEKALCLLCNKKYTYSSSSTKGLWDHIRCLHKSIYDGMKATKGEKQKDVNNTNIFDWWKQNATNYPLLAKVARILLSIPATSVASERLFSKAGLIYSNTLRNRLGGEMAQSILLVKANLEKFPLKVDIEIDEEQSDDDEKISETDIHEI